jgi:putative transcriptional regulator
LLNFPGVLGLSAFIGVHRRFHQVFEITSGRLILRTLAAALLLHAVAAYAADTTLANGVFLVAKPEMFDPNFRETVVLITQPEVGGGPLGVIVNRPLDARLSEVIPGATQVPEQFDQIYGGGPVAPNGLLFLVRSSVRPERSLQVLADVYLSGDAGLIERIVRGEVSVPAFRAYAGYSGWAPGQLQAEIMRGGWYVIQADADTVFAVDASTVWPGLIRRIATKRALLLREKLFDFVHPRLGARVVAAGVFDVDRFKLGQQFALARRQVDRRFDDDVAQQIARGR